MKPKGLARLQTLSTKLKLRAKRLTHPTIDPDQELDPVRASARIIGAFIAAGDQIEKVPGSDPKPNFVDVLDIFSGCGGMSAGFRAVSSVLPSYRLAASLDIDGVANRTYARNLGLEPMCSDVREIENKSSQYLRFLASLDRGHGRPLVLIGCAPCQGFSSYRKDGRRDARNSLMGVFARLAVCLRPDVVIMENVPELFADRYWGFYSSAKQILEQAGFLVRARIYNMAEFGLPQERFRAVVFAMPKSFTMPKGFLPRSEFRTVRHAIEKLPPTRPGETLPHWPMHITAQHRPSTIATIKRVPKDGGRRPFDAGPESLRRLFQRQGKEAFEDIYGRLWWDRPAVTITHYSRNPASGRFLHPEQDRGISALEAALLQGFPSKYHFEGSFDEKFRQIGDAVPPRFSAYLAAHALGEMLATEVPADDTENDIKGPVGSSFSRLIAGLKQRSA